MFRPLRVWSLWLIFSFSLHAVPSDLASDVQETQDTPDDPAPVRLLPHQQFPIDYLKQHPEVKGLLINHYMGTGKTYLGIGFAEAFPDKDVVILAPGFIESHWLEHLRQFKVKNPGRYRFVSYAEAPQKLAGKDMSKTLLIIDEVHNIVKYIKSPDPILNRQYSDLYERLRTSYRIVGLSGTPIYSSEHDLAYLLNLVSGQDLLPFNEEEFRIAFTEIKRAKSFVRGYLSESQLLRFALPYASLVLAMPLMLVMPYVGIPLAIAGSLGSFLVFPLVNNKLAPIDQGQLRELSVEKFKPYISKYVSFHEIDNLDLSDFPAKTVNIREVPYSGSQFEFFLDLSESGLSNENLTRVFLDVDQKADASYLTLNSSTLQTRFKTTPGAGREIGNFDFKEDGVLVESPKFVEVLRQITSQGLPQTVVYSNYFENGIKAFARFLDRRGMSGAYAMLTPNMTPANFAKIVQDYNEGKVKILLLHPEITEGISLKRTRQFHILEPVLNGTLLDQVIARAVRYKSHESLPTAERQVEVSIWKSVIGSDWQTSKIKKANWFKRYSELNDWSDWGPGLRQIDKNYDRKKISPDDAALVVLQSVNTNVTELKQIIKENSVEKQLSN